MSEIQKMNKAASQLLTLKFLQQVINNRIGEMEGLFKIILTSKSFKGMAIVPGSESCRPSWKDEWKTLCFQLEKNPVVEEEVIKKRVGKKAGEPKIAIDEEFSPNEELKMHLIKFVEGL